MNPRGWLDWQGSATPRNLTVDASNEPTKLTKPGFSQFSQLAAREHLGISGAKGQNTAEPETITKFNMRGVPCQADEAGVSWAEWKATALNRLFHECGVTGQPGRITEATVRHGELSTGQ